MSTISTDEIINQALRQPEKERAFIAEILINSLDDEVDDDLNLAGQIEIDRRLNDIDSGKVKCLPWEEVRNKLFNNSND